MIRLANKDDDRSNKTFAEFFAGIGLVHLGLHGSGWGCLYANDIEPKKLKMYEAQFGEVPYYHVEDIWNADQVLHRLPTAPFLATASFPCIDLSLAGHWRGFDGEHSSTYFGFLEVIRRMGEQRPKMIMLENVFGFLTSHAGQDFTRSIRELAQLGYWIDAIVLDAKWFVPQSRPRVFVFGFHDSLKTPRIVRKHREFDISDPWREAINRSGKLRPVRLNRFYENVSLPTGWAAVEFSSPHQASYKLNDFIDVDGELEWWSPAEIKKHYSMMEPPSRTRVDELIRTGETTVGTAFRRTRRGHARTEVRFDLAGCLRTPKGGSAKQIVVAITKGDLCMRWMTAREYARLQGAAKFPITVPDIQAMYGFGDAVCVPAIGWIDRNILTPVYEAHRLSQLDLRAIAMA